MVSLNRDGGLEKTLEALVVECACVGVGDQKEFPDSTVVVDTALPGESPMDDVSHALRSRENRHLSVGRFCEDVYRPDEVNSLGERRWWSNGRVFEPKD